MKIAIDLTPIYDHLTGIERYNINISQELIKHHPEDSFVLLFKNEVHKEFAELVKLKNVSYKILKSCNKLIFIQFRLLKEMNKIEADYYLFLSFTSPVFFKKKKTISAIHDLTCWDCPETIPTKMKYYYRLTFAASIRKDWKIVTVSQFSQKRICEKYNLNKNDVPIIYDGLSIVFSKELHCNQNFKLKYNLPKEYILSLSTIEPRKNLQLLIRAYKELIEENFKLPDLILAGRKGWKIEDVVIDISNEIKEKIHFTGFIDDEDLPQIYKDAYMFVFPSKYEGFGLPVIEAMSQGTLVICSDAASLPEIAGDAGLLFESNNIDSLKSTIKKAINMNSNEIQKKCDLGKKIANSYSWDKESEKLYKIMKNDK